MQFQYNADYPGLNSSSASLGNPASLSRDPASFPQVEPSPCARITTRVYHPKRNKCDTVQNVLVRMPPVTHYNANVGSSDDDSFSSGMSSSSSSSNSMMKLDGGGQASPEAASLSGEGEIQNAYWIQRTIREAIYGRVLFAVVLKRRRPGSSSTLPAGERDAEWEVTSDHCAVKEMSWQHIKREKDRLAEDPIKEVAAMQYIQRWYKDSHQGSGGILTSEDGVADCFRAMRNSNIMMPLDLLKDDSNLYSIMPYCDGGELFERLDLNERFSEEEARYWMDQVLNGIENLQHVGVCHRDMSLENLLVHKDGALIIDMGMCVRIPFDDAAVALSASFNQMSMNGGDASPAAGASSSPLVVSSRGRPRYLIRPQGTCGKWIYMSPEIFQNSAPFDGYAVDMWAAGVILFLMLTGFPPWERACQTDERFHYMTSGYLVQMLTEWEIGLSSDAMDLLQRMLFLDPKDRLSLDQVRAHPWMTNGPRAQPLGLQNKSPPSPS